MSEQTEQFYVRFSIQDRLQHVLLVLSVFVLALTGMPQKYSSLQWARSMVEFLGGIYTIRFIHRISAGVLIALSVYHLVNFIYRFAFRREKFFMWPKWKDFQDFIYNITFFVGLRKDRPRFERFNYIEKFEYWAVVWGMGVMALSGALLWFPTIATRFIPGIVIPSAKAMHSGEALLAVSAVILWHLYNAHFSPRVFPFNKSMYDGLQSEKEAMVEHPLEYERLTGKPVPQEIVNASPEVSWFKLLFSGLVGALLVVGFVFIFYWTVQPPSPQMPPPLNRMIGRQGIQPGEENQYSGIVSVSGGLKAAFSYGWLSTEDGKLVSQFSDQSTGEVKSWFWEFGDGSTSFEQDPTHTYTVVCPSQSGACTVRLTVCNLEGCASTLQQLELPNSK